MSAAYNLPQTLSCNPQRLTASCPDQADVAEHAFSPLDLDCRVRSTPALQVRTQPWWDAQYFIPMLGMMLGSCVSAVSIGLTNLLAEVTNGALVSEPAPEPDRRPSS